MVELTQRIHVLAASDSTTVLLTGELGVGRRFVAKMIHQLSTRAGCPFLSVNSRAVPGPDLENTVFGEGDATPGILEQAGTGTAFLAEVDALPAGTQQRLLNALQSSCFRRTNGVADIPLGARIIAGTERSLEEEVRAGRFQEDLYLRLSVVLLPIPPMRDRSVEDKTQLVHHFVTVLGRELRGHPREIDAAALAKLLDYPWPGNVRELRNVIERAIIVAGDDQEIKSHHLPVEVRGRRASDGATRILSLADLERLHIERTLKFRKGNRTVAARDLGIARATLIKKIKSYNLDL
jgi:DNA-binding NtrC family response regulator